MLNANSPSGFLDLYPQVICARLDLVRGSAPRDVGTLMLVSQDDIWNTLGGGQLERMVIEAAREMLQGAQMHRRMNVPLGPEINQCCGGRVDVTLFQPSEDQRREIIQSHDEEIAQRPDVYVFGAGHVGRDLCNLLQFMPVRTILVDERAAEQRKCTASVERVETALPESLARGARKGSAAVILTHSHDRDFVIAAEALAAGSFAYVGMIGSNTKRAKFQSWFRATQQQGDAGALICPVGSAESPDKRPAVIASFVVAEVMQHLSMWNGVADAAAVTQATISKAVGS